MIGLDANVLVRYCTQDDVEQSSRAGRLIEAKCRPDAPGYVSAVIVCELVWVLASGYGYAKADIIRLLRAMLETPALKLEHAERIWEALRRYERGKASFADYLIGGACREVDAVPVYTFDRHAAADARFTSVP